MLLVVLRPIAQFFTRHLQALKELKSVNEHHASLLMLIDLPFWEAMLLDAMQHFQNTAFGRLAHVYAIGEDMTNASTDCTHIFSLLPG